jgi:hypothetical protein
MEAAIFNALKTLVGNRCYPDVAPEGVARPFIVYQQVGGRSFNFLESAPVGLRNASVQVSCWANSRQAANDLARNAENAMLAIKATALGAFVGVYEEDTRLYGAQQDFSIFY